VFVLPVEELLEMVMVPLAAPVTVGSKLTCRLTACAGFRVTGKVAPEIAKPLPARVTELIVTGAVPEDVRVSVWVNVVFNVTVPKARLPALTFN